MFASSFRFEFRTSNSVTLSSNQLNYPTFSWCHRRRWPSFLKQWLLNVVKPIIFIINDLQDMIINGRNWPREEPIVVERMDLELHDYPPSGANGRHTPRVPYPWLVHVECSTHMLLRFMYNSEGEAILIFK